MAGRVVVLDDDKQVVDLILLVLRRDGHQVEGVRTFEGALEALSRKPADLFVSDLSMPGIGGIAGIRALSRKGLIRRALVVSGYIDPDSESLIAQMPEVVGRLEKPFDVNELARLVRRFVPAGPEKEAAAEG